MGFEWTKSNLMWDGAYNMRYEIVKKRIDKVKIKDRNERLNSFLDELESLKKSALAS